MFGFGKKKIVAVQYIEVGKKSPFKTEKVKVADLPDSFEIDGPWEVGGEKWLVVAAVPDSKEEFEKSGKVDLFLSKDTPTVPESALFVVPTINDEIGMVTDREVSGETYTVHEDDWRQHELISRTQLETVRKELAEVEKVLKTQRQGEGYKSIHIRTGLPGPLKGAEVTVSVLWDAFEFSRQYGGVAIGGYQGAVDGGFALEAPGIGTFWGELDESGKLACLNITLPDSQTEWRAAHNALIPFCTKYNLLVAHWPTAKTFSPPPPQG